MNKSYDVHVDQTSAALLVHLLLQSHDKTLYSISHNQTDNFVSRSSPQKKQVRNLQCREHRLRDFFVNNISTE